MTPVDEGLRRALHQQAAATTPPPDAWEGIRARLERRGRPGRGAVVLVAACAVVVVLVAASVGGGGDRRLDVTAEPGRLFLAPTGVDGRYRLLHAVEDPGADGSRRNGEMKVFGRRAPDGVTVSASVVVEVPAEPIGGDPEDTPLTVAGEQLTVLGDDYGRRMVSWAQTDGRPVGVVTFGLSDEELVALVASLRPASALDTPTLPAGFVPLHHGPAPREPFPLTDQRWQAADGESFSVAVADVAGVTLDVVAGHQPGGRAVAVRGTTAVFSDRDGSMLTWIERPDTVVSVMSPELDEATLRRIAEGLQRIEEPEWRRLYASAERHEPSQGIPPVPAAGPAEPASEASFFSVRPVLARSEPPCASEPPGPSPVMTEVHAGVPVACYEVGPPAFGADDVASATVRQAGAVGTWHVELTLSAQGRARFAALVRTVGLGGQVAAVIDGRVLSAPVIASTTLGDAMDVSGLDEKEARSLAERLRN